MLYNLFNRWLLKLDKCNAYTHTHNEFLSGPVQHLYEWLGGDNTVYSHGVLRWHQTGAGGWKGAGQADMLEGSRCHLEVLWLSGEVYLLEICEMQ